MGNTFGDIIGLPSPPDIGIVDDEGRNVFDKIYEDQFKFLNQIRNWFLQITEPIDRFFRGIVEVFDVIWELFLSIFGFMYIGALLALAFYAIFYIIML